MNENRILYRYLATVLKCVDGDTLTLVIDEGFKHTWKTNCRLAHINTPELRSKDETERSKAQAAKQYLAERLPIGTEVYIISKRLDKYGRPIAEVYLGDVLINQEMIDKGFAVSFM